MVPGTVVELNQNATRKEYQNLSRDRQRVVRQNIVNQLQGNQQLEAAVPVHNHQLGEEPMDVEHPEVQPEQPEAQPEQPEAQPEQPEGQNGVSSTLRMSYTTGTGTQLTQSGTIGRTWSMVKTNRLILKLNLYR